MIVTSWPAQALSRKDSAQENRSPDAMVSSMVASLRVAASMSASACAPWLTTRLAFSSLSIAVRSLLLLCTICSRRVLMIPNQRPAITAMAPIATRISLSRLSLESRIMLTRFFGILAFERERDETSARIVRVGLFRRDQCQLGFLQIRLEIGIIIDRSLQLENLIARSFGEVLGVQCQHYFFPGSGRSAAAHGAVCVGGRLDAFADGVSLVGFQSQHLDVIDLGDHILQGVEGGGPKEPVSGEGLQGRPLAFGFLRFAK